MTDTTRDAFEAECRRYWGDRCPNLEFKDHKYESGRAEIAYAFWQAATLAEREKRQPLWLPIADAPKDGTEIGCWNPKEPGIIRRVKWGHHLKNELYTHGWVTVTNSLNISNLPTLWLPLPPTSAPQGKI